MSISRKDFVAIAAAIKGSVESETADIANGASPDDGGASLITVLGIVDDLSEVFVSANDRFNYLTFRGACGFTPEVIEWINKWGSK
jgi:hypothetical protein